MMKMPVRTLAVLAMIASGASHAQQAGQSPGGALAVPLPAAPAPAPDPAGSPVDPAAVASLRAAYDDLRRREAEAATLAGPLTPETRAAQEAAAARAAELEALVAQGGWEAGTMAWFADDIRQRAPLALPQDTPAGMTPALALATVAQGALYYDSPPPFRDATLQGSFPARGVVLRIAEAPGIQLVWVPAQGFAFMSGQSLEIVQ